MRRMLPYLMVLLIGVAVGTYLAWRPRPVVPPALAQADVGDLVDPVELILERVFAAVAPAVVSIRTERVTLDLFLRPRSRPADGSGVVIDQQGHIVTNNHVVAEAQEITITFEGGETMAARLVGADQDTDLAVLLPERIPSGMRFAQLGASQGLKVGQRVIAIGNPFGIGQSLTAGFISALGRTITTQSNNIIFDVVQTDAAINPGNSGGPLLNSQGEVIGITTAIATQDGRGSGVGFAIPVDTVRQISGELITQGRVIRPYTGILSAFSASLLPAGVPLPTRDGVVIAEVDPNSPAGRAGLLGATRQVPLGRFVLPLGGDIVLAVDGFAVRNEDELFARLSTRRVGQQAVLAVNRDGRRLDLTLELDMPQ